MSGEEQWPMRDTMSTNANQLRAAVSESNLSCFSSVHLEPESRSVYSGDESSCSVNPVRMNRLKLSHKSRTRGVFDHNSTPSCPSTVDAVLRRPIRRKRPKKNSYFIVRLKLPSRSQLVTVLVFIGFYLPPWISLLVSHAVVAGYEENVAFGVTEILFNVINLFNPLLYTLRHPVLRTQSWRMMCKIHPLVLLQCKSFPSPTVCRRIL